MCELSEKMAALRAHGIPTGDLRQKGIQFARVGVVFLVGSLIRDEFVNEHDGAGQPKAARLGNCTGTGRQQLISEGFQNL